MDDSVRLLIKVAYLYYIGQQRQEDIARALNLSRSTISRMLMEARERGLVEIKINFLGQSNIGLEQQLEQTFGLKEAVVAPDPLDLPGGAGEAVANAAAHYLGRVLKPGDILGVSSGTTLARVARALRGHPPVDATVVQLVGQTGFGDGSLNGLLSGYETVRAFAAALHARYQLLIAPMITEQEQFASLLRSEPLVQHTLEMARRARISLIGIGAMDESSDLVQTGCLSLDDLMEFARRGAAGEVCARFFDRHGNAACRDFDARVIGYEREDLRACPLVVAVAFGSNKIGSILGALRSGGLDVLVTDEPTAAAVLERATREAVEDFAAAPR